MGVLLEIAKSVNEDKVIDVSMGNVNVIWQGDANEMAIKGAALFVKYPQKILNITGPETVSIRWLAQQFGAMFGKVPRFIKRGAVNIAIKQCGGVISSFWLSKCTIEKR
jgi:hypothetical protein